MNIFKRRSSKTNAAVEPLKSAVDLPGEPSYINSQVLYQVDYSDVEVKQLDPTEYQPIERRKRRSSSIVEAAQQKCASIINNAPLDLPDVKLQQMTDVEYSVSNH